MIQSCFGNVTNVRRRCELGLEKVGDRFVIEFFGLVVMKGKGLVHVAQQLSSKFNEKRQNFNHIIFLLDNFESMKKKQFTKQ